MKPIYTKLLIIFATIILYSCATEDCTTETRFYDSEEYTLFEKDSVTVAYLHQIRLDTIIAGFMTIDTSQVEDPENPDETIAKYDTTIINPDIQLNLSNELHGLNENKSLTMGDSITFGSEDMKENYSLIKILFSNQDSTGVGIVLNVNEGMLYQDCSQW